MIERLVSRLLLVEASGEKARIWGKVWWLGRQRSAGGAARSAKLREYLIREKPRKAEALSEEEGSPVCAGEPVTKAKRVHPFPSRTRKLSSSAPMILCGQLHGKIGRCRFTRSHRRSFL